MPSYSRLDHETTEMLLRAIIAVCMRRLGLAVLDINSEEFEAKDKGNVSLFCKKRPGGGFIVELTDNVQIAEHN